MENGVRSRGLGSLQPMDSLADVIVVFRAAREWSVEVDEQLRTEGQHPMGAMLAMPAEQLDTIIVILEAADRRITHLEADTRRRVTYGILLAIAAIALAVVNIALGISLVVF